MESAEENDLDDERITMYRKSVECTRMSIVILLILITWMMSGGNR